jgi:hypothetical protein
VLALWPAPPRVRTKWRGFAFTTGGLSALLVLVRSKFPEDLLRRFPEYENFIYAALAISIISALFLVVIDKVIAVSFAQLGSITSLLYIGYALFGIFSGPLLPVFAALMIMAMLVMLVIFGQSLAFVRSEGTTVDLALGVIMLMAALFMCAYPLYQIIFQAQRG